MTAALGMPTEGARAAGSDSEACASASEDGQLFRIQKKLREARAKFLECSREVCPPPVRRDCAQQLEQTEQSIPTVVLSVQDERGTEIVDARVFIDGELLADRLDGVGVRVDPGLHVLRFEI